MESLAPWVTAGVRCREERPCRMTAIDPSPPLSISLRAPPCAGTVNHEAAAAPSREHTSCMLGQRGNIHKPSASPQQQLPPPRRGRGLKNGNWFELAASAEHNHRFVGGTAMMGAAGID